MRTGYLFSGRRWSGRALVAGGLLLASAGCSIRSLAINALAKSLAASGDVFASDEDPELVRDATPFALKTMETLLAEKPKHKGLLLSACRGFAQYAYAFVETEAEELEEVDYAAASREYGRALKLYLRARDYCLRSLELESPGIRGRLESFPEAAVVELDEELVPLLFWTGASWGGAISLGQDRPEIVVDLPAVRALIGRVFELDEAYDRGAVHGAMIVVEALPEAMGGSPERARHHFQRAVELSGGLDAGPYVILAESVSVAAQDWREFESLLEQALAIDPDGEPGLRLANTIAQRRARRLLDR
ncbi:MAG: TRAP transporter TatT component family protein, partial [Thermoanaerobaculia bacterium]